MYGIIVDRALNALAIAELFDVFDQKICLQRIRVVIIQLLALLKWQVIVLLIIIVMINYSDVISEAFT